MPAQGQLSEMDVSSILQMLCIGRRKSVLRLECQIVHATLGPLDGKEAFFRLVMWRDGSFWISNRAEAPARTIEESWDLLLLEGARRIVAWRLERGPLRRIRRVPPS